MTLPPAASKATPHSAQSALQEHLVFPVSAFSDNYIWVIADVSAGDAIVVDPGQAQPVIQALEARGLRLSAILLTHHHADHVGGVGELLEWSTSTVPVYGPANEAIKHVTVALREGDVVDIASPKAHFTVIDVPGHTLGHIAFFQATVPPALFCGDTLFATGCGRIFEGTPAQMHASLQKLAALPESTRVYCAHEYTLSNIRFALAADENNADLLAWSSRAQALRASGEPTLPTTLAQERRVNPFLRADNPAVHAALTRKTGTPPADTLAAFTALRAWKDKF